MIEHIEPIKEEFSHEDQVILVDNEDRVLAYKEKLAAHVDGDLHRAFSIFLFNNQGQLLIQQRAEIKYHSAGLWTNTCCSHPRPGEETGSAAVRRLKEEMGLEVPLSHAFSFTYRAKLENGLWEHELDHVYFGRCETAPAPNPKEVQDWSWLAMADIEEDINRNPHKYTFWFKFVFDQVTEALPKWRSINQNA